MVMAQGSSRALTPSWGGPPSSTHPRTWTQMYRRARLAWPTCPLNRHTHTYTHMHMPRTAHCSRRARRPVIAPTSLHRKPFHYAMHEPEHRHRFQTAGQKGRGSDAKRPLPPTGVTGDDWLPATCGTDVPVAPRWQALPPRHNTTGPAAQHSPAQLLVSHTTARKMGLMRREPWKLRAAERQLHLRQGRRAARPRAVRCSAHTRREGLMPTGKVLKRQWWPGA